MPPLEDFYFAYIQAIHRAMAGVYQSTYDILDAEFQKQKLNYLSQVDAVADTVEADKSAEVDKAAEANKSAEVDKAAEANKSAEVDEKVEQIKAHPSKNRDKK